MRHLPLKRQSSTDTYHDTLPEMPIYDENGNFAGYMIRTGITPPGYPMFAVYGKRPFSIGDPTYVFEAGHFWPSYEWRRYYYQTGKTPGECKTD